MNGFRLPAGGRVDRSAPLPFTFDGRPFAGYAGDTLASALLANGVRVVGRSFKYHRPRGILSAGSEEPNALVTIDRGGGRIDPNTRATVQELFAGLAAESQNRWPSLRFDLGAAVDRLHPLVPAGFYYKTFMWPPVLWHRLYEPLIRRAAGLGRAPTAPDPDRYSARYAHCEVLVVGAGPAGLAAALAASEAGGRVILADEQSEPGGGLLAEPAAGIGDRSAAAWLAASLAELRRRPNVTLLPRTTAIGAYHANMVALVERVADHRPEPPAGAPRQRLWRVRAGAMVLAAGATERPLLFPGNDRPGVMLAGAARAYCSRYGVAVGRRVAVATSDDAAWEAAFDLADAGVEVAAIADLRPSVDAGLEGRARQRRIAVYPGASVTGTAGHHGIRSVTIAPASGPPIRLACDALLMSGGWTPNVHLFSHGRGSLAWEPGLGAYVPAASPEHVHPAGAANGTLGLEAAIAEGRAAGQAASGRAPPPRRAGPQPAPAPAPATAAGRAFVDFQNDVTAKDIRLAVAEGYRSVEHVKRYTTAGMATDQGRTGNLNALAVAAAALGRPLPELGVTTFRPPYTPAAFGTLAGHARGDGFAPVRRTPTHDWAEASGAVFEPVGLWRRARYYPLPGEDMAAAVARECLAVRNAVGICDASTLGKIAVTGPDAAAFLDRIYVNAMGRLQPGRCRYGLMLGEDGYILDDGVVARLSADAFHVTTTSGGIDRVLVQMEDFRQTEWPELRVWLTPVTEQWAVIGVNGPRARELIAPLVEGIDLAPAAMPHMSVREGRIAGRPLRLFRVSFTGELGYELNVPASAGADLWQCLLDAGRALGVTSYGTEAMHVLRAEKGYIIPGQDTDGTVTPDDVGLAGMIGRDKPDFVGRRSLALPALAAPGRRQLVGLVTGDPRLLLEEGSQIIASEQVAVPAPMLGHVTSSYRSAALGRSIALALVADGRARIGATLHVPAGSACHPVTVTAPLFYDPEGARLHG